EDRARLDRAAVDVHRASAALRGVAADVRSGQLQLLAQELDEQRARIDRPADGLAVDGEGNGNVHADLLLGGAGAAILAGSALENPLFNALDHTGPCFPLVRFSHVDQMKKVLTNCAR